MTELTKHLTSRIVVNAVGDPAHGCLAESRFVDRPFLPGGEQNLYELAFAAASLGHDVELRGWLDRAAFERLAAGAAARPRVDLPARRPEANDLVVVPEGWQNPLDYARLLLSPARLALFILAAPGLFGWPFVAEPWEPPDPLTVPLEELARPEHFRGMAAIGFRLLTHSPGLAAAAHSAGVECAFVGTGRPGWTAMPEVEKSVDVAAVLDNRWAPLAERVLEQLSGLTIDRIETVENREMLLRLARARVLVWPSRIEGHATIPWEARGVGSVPVALGSNRFAIGLDEAHGAVTVDRVDELAPAVRGLLADDSRWMALSRRARETAPSQVDWPLYLERARGFLDASAEPDPGRAPRAGMGLALGAWLEQASREAHARLEEKDSELAIAGRDLTAAMEQQERMIAEISHWRTLQERLARESDALARESVELRAEVEALRAENERVTRELRGLMSRRSVRAALRVADTIRTKPR